MSLVTAQTGTSAKERYSFSKLSSWRTCPYGWKLRYIDGRSGEGNAFSSYGTFVHGIMERYANGELEIWDLPNVYEWEFESAIPQKFPKIAKLNMKDNYYKQGLSFLQEFEGYDKYEILDVERSFDIDIDDWTFNGVIDLVFRDEAGRLIIRDYKSKASFTSKKEKAEYARQLYLYSMYVKEKYGEYPAELQFLMFRKNDLVVIPFDPAGVEEAINWAREIVAEIREAFDYPPMCRFQTKNDTFYADNLCNHRGYCEFKAGRED